MSLFATMGRYASLMRDFLAPRYHPERHYMRGPGPACARRHHTSRDLTFG
jgi:hypothetical protein